MLPDDIWDRRKFLKSLAEAGVCVTAWKPLTVLFGSLLQGAISKAQAAEAGVESRNFLSIYLAGGPPRWFFDLPMDPLNTGRFQEGTLYNGVTSSGAYDYKQIPVTAAGKTYQMPELWGCQIPRPGGGYAPMSELMNHMLILRGIAMGGGDHEIASRLMRPVPDVPSLDGMVADHSNTALSALDFGTPYLFKSVSGKGVRAIKLQSSYNSTYTGFHHVMSPFINSTDGLSSSFVSRRAALELGTQSVLTALKNYSLSSRPGAQALYADRQSAEDLIRKGVGDLSAMWGQIFGKYSALLTRCNDATRIIPFPLTRDGHCRDAATQANNADFRTTVVPETRIRNWAEQLAIAEFLFSRGLGSSIVLRSTALELMKFAGTTIYSSNTGNTVSSTSTSTMTYSPGGGDEHFARPKMSILHNSVWFYHIATGLYELIQSLKAANKFDNTVIQICSEFSRVPRSDRVGTDHASDTGSLTLFSGVIKQPIIIGNIKIGTNLSENTTIGRASAVRHDGANTVLTWEHAISTTAALLRVPSPTANFRPLVVEQNGAIVPVVGLPENKDT
jgi:hypothetical protein